MSLSKAARGPPLRAPRASYTPSSPRQETGPRALTQKLLKTADSFPRLRDPYDRVEPLSPPHSQGRSAQPRSLRHSEQRGLTWRAAGATRDVGSTARPASAVSIATGRPQGPAGLPSLLLTPTFKSPLPARLWLSPPLPRTTQTLPEDKMARGPRARRSLGAAHAGRGRGLRGRGSGGFRRKTEFGQDVQAPGTEVQSPVNTQGRSTPVGVEKALRRRGAAIIESGVPRMGRIWPLEDGRAGVARRAHRNSKGEAEGFALDSNKRSRLEWLLLSGQELWSPSSEF